MSELESSIKLVPKTAKVTEYFVLSNTHHVYCEIVLYETVHKSYVVVTIADQTQVYDIDKQNPYLENKLGELINQDFCVGIPIRNRHFGEGRISALSYILNAIAESIGIAEFSIRRVAFI